MLPWWLLRWLFGTAAAGAAVAWLILGWRCRRQRRHLQGKVAFVSGATSGLGEALAEALVERGAFVVLGGRDLVRLGALRQRLADRAGATSGGVVIGMVQMDLGASDEELGESGVAGKVWSVTDGRLDIVVNNAGVSYRGEVLNTKAEVHRQLMQVNYFGHVALTTGLCRLASAQGRALTIVGISSLQGLVSQPYRSAYAASKHAFQAFHDCLRAELACRGFRVLTVSPAYISTSLSVNALTGSGAAYAKLDETTKKGMPPMTAAGAVLDALESGACGRQELLLGPWHMRAAPLLRHLAPGIMFKVMSRRATAGGVTK